MPEIHSTAENSKGAAERATACADCTTARDDLEALVLADQQPDLEQRRKELLPWAKVNLSECVPHDRAVEICLQIEADELAAGFPGFRVDQLGPEELREEVMAYMTEAQAVERNATTTGQIDDGVPAKVPAEVGEESSELARERHLSGERQALETENLSHRQEATNHAEAMTGKETKADELEKLQHRFNALRVADIGTSEALRQISTLARSPETQRRLNALMHRVTMLQTALPDKPKVVNRLLDSAGLNLAAATLSASFASFIAAAETEEALTASDRQTLRRIIDQGDRYLKTGSQVYETALITVTDPVTGEPVPQYTPENKARVRDGVYTFTETGHNVILELRQGSLHERADVTGLDGASIGIVAEIFSLAALAHHAGADGFIKHVYGVDFERFTTQRLDPITLIGVQRKLTHLCNTGHDSEIFRPEQQEALLKTQMRLTSPDGELLAWKDNPEGYRQRVRALGLQHDVVLEEFGRYTRLHHHTGSIAPEALQAHLHQKFPDLVTPPNSDMFKKAA
ncbi:MAG: hypothetical protein AAF420_13710 [Pseudomonadota bacterium]